MNIEDNLVPLLQQLVKLPSVSPMGEELPKDSEILGEARVTEFLQSWGSDRDFSCTRQTVAERRDNVVFVLEGRRPGVLLWEVHQDTVPIDGMTVDPFGGELRDGRIYGRGACDVKGGMTVMLAALERLQRVPADERCTILLACTVDEEQGGSGALALPELWQSHALPKPDAAVIAEPTQLNIVVAHKGVTRWRCVTHGVAAHSSNPSAGDSAIQRMAHVVLGLERYHNDVLVAKPPHPLLGTPTLSVGTIRGGAGVNLVPDHCEVQIDHRLLPGTDPRAAQQEAAQYLVAQGLQEEHVSHDAPFLESIGLSDADNQSLAQQLAAAAATVGVRSEFLGVPFGTDAARLSPHMPCVVFGPGDIAQAHTVDEWIEVSQLAPATSILVALAQSFSP